MSRHRDVRSMNYSDEYDGYDDVYGHSVEDDVSMSPGAEQFIYDRNRQQNMASFFIEPDITEADEDEATPDTPKKPELSELDTAKLASCMEIIRNVIGDEMTEAMLTEEIIKANFDAEIALDKILKATSSLSLSDTPVAVQRPELQAPGSSSKSSPLNLSKPIIFSLPKPNDEKINSLSELMFNHKLNLAKPQTEEKKSFNSLSKLIANHSAQKENTNSQMTEKTFSTLADLTAHHMQKSNSPSSNKSSFVIPKFTLKKNNTTNNSPSPLPIVRNLIFKKNQTDSVSTLKNNLFDTEITSKPVELKIDNNLNDDKIDEENTDIDLSSVLRQTKPLPSAQKTITKVKTPCYDLKEIFLMSAEPIPSSMIADSLQLLDCQINASNLQYQRLNYSNNSCSMFGKTICRRWRLKKPYVKHSKSEYTENITPFDFSSPSPDSLILANVRRK